MSGLPGSLKRVLEYLQNVARPVSVEEVANALGIKTTTAKKYLDQLVRLGYINREGGTYWVEVKKEELVEKKVEEKVEKPVEKVEEKPCEKPVEEKKVPSIAEAKHRYYFYRSTGEPIVLGIKSLEQLWAAIKFGFVDEDALSYSIQTGLLPAWISHELGSNEVAKEFEQLKGVEPSNVVQAALQILEKYVKVEA